MRPQRLTLVLVVALITAALLPRVLTAALGWAIDNGAPRNVLTIVYVAAGATSVAVGVTAVVASILLATIDQFARRMERRYRKEDRCE